MSDDTPTQRLPETPDEPMAEPEATGEPERGRTKSRTLLYVLIGLAAAILVAIIVLLVVLLNGDASPAPDPSPTTTSTPTASGSPSPASSGSASPTPTSVPTPDSPQPEPEVSTIVGYSVSTTDAGCASDDDSREITFNWNTTGTSVTFAIGTEFAETGAYQSDLAPVVGITVNYQCGEEGPNQIYSIAAIGPNGDVIGRETISVRD